MKNSFIKRTIAFLLGAVMVLGMLPMSALAAIDFDTAVTGEYYNVLSKKEYNLAPGAKETEIVLNNDAGSRRQQVHVFEVDTKNPNIQVLPGYYGIDKLDPENLSDSTHWTDAKVTDTVKYYEEELGYNVVGAMNTALAYDSNAPYDFMVYNGVVLADPANHSGNAQTYLAIDREGNCELRSRTEPLKETDWTVIPANFGWLVKDGALVTKTPERTSSPASRSMIGIKADGTLVFCQVDGRISPTSVGLSNYEMGEMMLALGCVNAVNCDGGGSSTFVSKREGTDANEMRSIPSDGSERPTLNSVIIVSTAKADGKFDHATLASDYDYYAPNTKATIKATGVDAAGGLAPLPTEGITWALSDISFGTIADGVFTSNGKKGDVTVQMLHKGQVVGTYPIHVVDPDMFKFSVSATAIPHGESYEVDFACTYGADSWPVYVDGVYTLSASNNDVTINGGILTATNDTSKKACVVTAVYTNDPTKTALLNITLGAASKVIFDFEDGDRAGFMGFEEAKKWSEDNGVNNTLVGSSPLAGQFNSQLSSETFLASTDKGDPVRFGKHALAWSLDNTDADFNNWSYNVLFNVSDELVVLRDVANGMNAQRLGLWLYIPEGAAGLSFQSQLYVKNADGSYSCKQDHFTFVTNSGVTKNLNSCTEADIPENRWVYASIDITKYDYLCMPVATDEGNSRSPSFVRTYVKPGGPAVHTFYIDDITLEYVVGLEDRTLPTITDVSYAPQDTAIELSNGATIDGTKFSLSANIADNVALNTASGKIYLDGVELSGVTTTARAISSSEITVLPGIHTVIFEVMDKQGNTARTIRTFTVAGDALIWLDGHNDSGAAAEYGSVYYVDIKTSDLAKIEGFTTTLRLQTANTWELDGITVAPGYQVTTSLNSTGDLLTLTVTKINGVAPAMLATDATIVSIPVRVWTWDGFNYVTGEPEPVTSNSPEFTIDCDVRYGTVELANGTTATFGGKINGLVNKTALNELHKHVPYAIEDQQATCTVNGYTGRTYCDGCKSVVDWGTIIPATGHTYEIVDSQLVCHCGEVVTGSGLVNVNGEIYCLIADKIVTGWQMVEDGWCYANHDTKEVYTGEFVVSGRTYTANEKGVIVKGAWVTDAKGTRYSFGPAYYTREWAEIDGATYYFGTDGYMYTGTRHIPVNRNNPETSSKWYEFAEDGKFIKEYTNFTGFLQDDGFVDGDYYYIVDGLTSYGYIGIVYVDGYYYHVAFTGYITRNWTMRVTNTHGLIAGGTYTFDEQGRITNIKNGICVDETDGKLYYYENSFKVFGGLMLIDGNYYYAMSNGEIVTNRNYWISKTNDLLPEKKYEFGADGKMLNPPVIGPVDPDAEPKNGIVQEPDGKLYYYENGKLTYGGLMYIDGYYYYATSAGEIITSRNYWISKTNDLLPEKKYEFGADGKMLNPPAIGPVDPDAEPKNGIVQEADGKLYYYENGKLTYAGLIKIDGYYYYVTSAGEVITDRNYWITKTNGLMAEKKYQFGADGKMLNPPTEE